MNSLDFVLISTIFCVFFCLLVRFCFVVYFQCDVDFCVWLYVCLTIAAKQRMSLFHKFNLFHSSMRSDAMFSMLNVACIGSVVFSRTNRQNSSYCHCHGDSHVQAWLRHRLTAYVAVYTIGEEGDGGERAVKTNCQTHCIFATASHVHSKHNIFLLLYFGLLI